MRFIMSITLIFDMQSSILVVCVVRCPRMFWTCSCRRERVSQHLLLRSSFVKGELREFMSENCLKDYSRYPAPNQTLSDGLVESGASGTYSHVAIFRSTWFLFTCCETSKSEQAKLN
ncbi:hypothetical protein F2P81_010178 [Scophthalmus maximus]|uniref:Secreted protein n=1 Tax=Scophthalmus maximus TaxID=52904 RepID=A0A6A4T259_SCOMX|nr:hypothetical protein F2P81_010178 [Scophthalmus maximus]